MASVTITTTAPQDARLTVAFGEAPSGAQRHHAGVKAGSVEQLRVVVRNYEDNVAKAAVAAPASFDPT
jgi:hypothetical protein